MRRALPFLLLAAALHADEIVLAGGGRISCEVVSEDEREVTVRLPNGTMAIPRAKIREIVREDPREYLRREAGLAPSKQAAVDLFERAYGIAPDAEREQLAAALASYAEELLLRLRLDDAEAVLARLAEVAPGAPSLPLSERLLSERRIEREARSAAEEALAARRFREALARIEPWRLRRPDGDVAVRGALARAYLGAAREDEAGGALRPALDHYRMAEALGARASDDLRRLAPVAVLEAMHGGDLEGAARLLGTLSGYGDPAVPRFLAAVLAQVRGDVQQAVAAYAEAARLAGKAPEGWLTYEVVRAYAGATLEAAIARPPEEGQRKWRETFLSPLYGDDSCKEFIVYAATAEMAQAAAAEADAIYARIVEDLLGGLPAGPKAEIVLHPTREAYLAADPTPEGSPLAGLSLGREPTAGVCYDTLDEDGKPLIRVEADAGQPRWLSDTLPHELVHLVQRRGWKAFRKQHWLDEGLATLYESPEAQGSRLALWLNLSDQAIPLPEMLSLRSTPPDRAVLFYVQAHALARYLRDLGGQEEWRRFLDALGDSDFEAALRAVYGVTSVTDLERSFRAWRG